MFLIDALLSENPTGTEWVFLMSAILGSFFFVLKILLAVIVGFGDDLDFDSGESDLDIDGDAGDGGHAEDTGAALKFLSLNAILAFFMMFGWAGLAAHVQYQMGIISSTIVALVVGLFTMYLTAWLLLLLRRLASAGADFRMESVVGQQAEVYQRIPADGRGKIHVYINGVLRELDASHTLQDDIESFTTVMITGLNGQSSVVVEPISAD